MYREVYQGRVQQGSTGRVVQDPPLPAFGPASGPAFDHFCLLLDLLLDPPLSQNDHFCPLLDLLLSPE